MAKIAGQGLRSGSVNSRLRFVMLMVHLVTPVETFCMSMLARDFMKIEARRSKVLCLLHYPSSTTNSTLLIGRHATPPSTATCTCIPKKAMIWVQTLSEKVYALPLKALGPLLAPWPQQSDLGMLLRTTKGPKPYLPACPADRPLALAENSTLL